MTLIASGTSSALTPSEQRGIIALSSLGHTVCHMAELVFAGAISAVMIEFGLHPAMAATLGLLCYVLMGVGAIPAGIWADAWGPRRVLLVYFLATAACSLTVAIAPGVWALFAALTGVGLAISLFHPTGLAMLAHGIQKRGRAMGIHGAAGSLGVALGPALGKAMADAGEWRWAYVVVAGVSLVGAAWVALLLRAGVSDLPMTRVLKRDPATTPDAPAPGPTLLGPMFLLAVMMIGGFNYRCLMTALPPFLGGSGDHAALGQGGLFVFLVLIVGGVGQIAGGLASDRFGTLPVYAVLVGSLAVLALVVRPLEGSLFALLPLGLLACCLFAQQPVENSLLAETASRSRQSLSYGLKFALTFGVGALGAPVAGLVWQYSGTPATVFLLIAGGACVMATLLYLFARQNATVVVEPEPVVLPAPAPESARVS